MQKDNIIINKIIMYLHRIEDAIVGLLLISLLSFSLLQIILRNFFNSGFVWGDSFLRVLVLWLCLAGAILASRKGKQINIDVLSQLISSPYKEHVKKINLIFTAIVCLIISYYSFLFVQLEYKDATIAFEQVPAWLTESIIPVGFFVMGIKYIFKVFQKNESC